MNWTYRPGSTDFPPTGLRLWLDGDAKETLEADANGALRTWKNKAKGAPAALASEAGFTREEG